MQIETCYARRGDATIAWTVAGDAPTDLLFVPGFISHVEHLWEQPGLAGFFERLMSFSRLIIMDRRGCGLSDPRTGTLSLDDEARDVLAVLDAAGSERAVLMGYTTGGLLAIATAALAPERVQAIVLYASMARALANDNCGASDFLRSNGILSTSCRVETPYVALSARSKAATVV